MDKEKFKGVLKKIWLPLVVVLAIGAGAALFSGAIRQAQRSENEKIVTLEQKTQGPAATESMQVTVSETDDAQAAYSVVDVLDGNSPSPPEGVLDNMEAAAVAVGYVEAIFDTQIENCKVFTHYYQYEGMPEAVYVISIDGESEQNCKYACSIDPVTGELQSARRSSTASDGSQGSSEESADDTLMEKAYNDPAVHDIVFSLIRDHFIGDRDIVEIMTDGVQWAFGEPDYDVQIDCKVHMSSGACYTVSIAYPGNQIISLDVYPLGWESCLWGVVTLTTPVPTSGWSVAEGVVDGASAGYATPRLTPTPVPKPK